jgi:hypothetical protein
MARTPTWEQGVTGYLEKLDKKLDDGLGKINVRIDTLYNSEITLLKVQMGKLETQVKIYAGIAGTIGAVVGAAIMKLVVK